MNWLKTKRNAERVYLYAGYSDEVGKERYKKLEKSGYILSLLKVKQSPSKSTFHNLKCPSCKKFHQHTIKHSGRRKDNCDSELTLDVINDGVRKKYSGIIVFSGDGDFSRMYEYVAEVLVKPVTIFSPMGAVAGHRTSTKVKGLHRNGIININALEGILGRYGIK